MVVLHQHAVVHAHAVVRAAAAGHGVLLEDAKPRRGLARIKNQRLVALRRLDELLRQCRRRRQTLHEIEGRPLGREDGPRLAAERQDRLLRLHGRSVRPQNLHLDLRIDRLHHRSRDRCAGHHAPRALRIDFSRRYGIRIDQRLGRGIAPRRPEVFVQGETHRSFRQRRTHHVLDSDTHFPSPEFNPLGLHQEFPMLVKDESQDTDDAQRDETGNDGNCRRRSSGRLR